MHTLIHDPLTRLIAQIVIVIVASRLLGIAARRIGQPMVIAEVVAGIALGPSLLGWLAPDLSAVLFATASMDTLKLTSQLGLVLFMFLVGLELDPRLLRGRGHTSVLISHASIVLPFALGVGLAFWAYDTYSPANVSFWAFALFMGAAMSITAFPVLARILTERRLMRTRVGAVAIACAAVDDVTAWCILAFVVAIARADHVASAAITTALSLGYIAAMVVVVRPLLGRLAARVATPEAITQNIVAIVVVVVFLSSWTTELIGIHALFGAFLLGAILPKTGGFARGLAGKLEDVVVVVLLPLFFAFSGLRTHIGLLDTVDDWLMCGVIIAVACVGKFGGSFVAARVTGLSWRESGALGLLMNTRGLMELIVLNIGLDLGVISPTVFSMMVIMALVTTFITTPLLEWIYPTHVMARDLVDVDTKEQEPIGSTSMELAAVKIEDAARGEHRVLVCIAHATAGPDLMAMAKLVATPPALALHLVSAQRQSELIDAGTDPAELMAPARAHADELGLPVRILSFVSTAPAADICRVAAVRDVSLILLGWHKPVLSQTLLGGVVHEVMQEATATVGVFVDRGLESVRSVLVPFHGSANDRAALALAGRVHKNAGATITVLQVVRPDRPRNPLSAEALAELAGVARVEVVTVDHASPAAAALERAADHDLLVVGIGREWGLGDRRFGLQPERLLTSSPTSILVVRAAPEAEAAEKGQPTATARMSDS
jgi:Kef-type K+ transport system membrane component KefB/nucleotide-binding universal stress UspA family protein